MGTLRGGLLLVLSIFLFLTLFMSVLFLTISLSLNYDTVQKEMASAIKGPLSDEIGIEGAIVNNYAKMGPYCETYSDYVVNHLGVRIVIPCSVVPGGQAAVLDYGIDQFTEEIYFDNYDCSFVSCFSEQSVPFFLISKKIQEDFHQSFNLLLIVIGLLSIVGFLLSERKSNFFILFAVLLVLAALPFAKFDLFAGLFGEAIQGLFVIFFGKASSVFIIVAIIGASLLVLGLVLKFFKIGFDISTIFSGKGKGKKDKDKDKDEEEDEKSSKKKKTKRKKKKK